MRFVVILIALVALVGCEDSQRRLVDTAIRFAYQCQREGRSQDDCRDYAQDTIDKSDRRAAR